MCLHGLRLIIACGRREGYFDYSRLRGCAGGAKPGSAAQFPAAFVAREAAANVSLWSLADLPSPGRWWDFVPCPTLLDHSKTRCHWDMPMNRCLRLLSCVLGILLLPGCTPTPPPAAPAAPIVTVALPIEREVVDHEEFTGRTDAVSRVDIRARVSGYLVKVNFKDGDIVKLERSALSNRSAAVPGRLGSGQGHGGEARGAEETVGHPSRPIPQAGREVGRQSAGRRSVLGPAGGEHRRVEVGPGAGRARPIESGFHPDRRAD